MEFCLKCGHNADEKGLTQDVIIGGEIDRQQCICGEELYSSKEVAEYFGQAFVWKHSYIDHAEIYPGDRVGLWLDYGTKTQFIMVKFSTILAILKNPTSLFTQHKITKKSQFKHQVQNRSFEIEFVKADGSVRQLNGTVYTSDNKPTPAQAKSDVIPVWENNEIRCFKMSRLKSLKIDNRVYLGVA